MISFTVMNIQIYVFIKKVLSEFNKLKNDDVEWEGGSKLWKKRKKKEKK